MTDRIFASEAETFGEWLSSRRKISQRDVAKRLGVHYSTVSLWESNKILPKLNPLQLTEYWEVLDALPWEYTEMCKATSPLV